MSIVQAARKVTSGGAPFPAAPPAGDPADGVHPLFIVNFAGVRSWPVIRRAAAVSSSERPHVIRQSLYHNTAPRQRRVTTRHTAGLAGTPPRSAPAARQDPGTGQCPSVAG